MLRLVRSMEPERHLVLGKPGTAWDCSGVEDGGSVLPVQALDLEPGEAVDLAADDDILVVAPVLPLELLAPVDGTGHGGGHGPISLTGVDESDEHSEFAEPPESAGSTGADPRWGLAAVGADRSSRTGRGVTVAVLDTGIDVDHPAFDHVAITTRNFTDGDDHDRDGHGTHCAGIIFGGLIDPDRLDEPGGRRHRHDDGVERIGVAPGVDRALIAKVVETNRASSEAVVLAIDWALRRGADVISMSLGVSFPCYLNELTARGYNNIHQAAGMALEGYLATVELFRALAELIHRGHGGRSALVVAACGNGSDPDCQPPVTLQVTQPAAADHILSVGAIGLGPSHRHYVAGFSNTGPDLVAPGVDVGSAIPTGGIGVRSGTSVAAPHVAGVAALWAEEQRARTGSDELDVAMLRSDLLGAADGSLLEGCFRRDIGTGIVQAPG